MTAALFHISSYSKTQVDNYGGFSKPYRDPTTNNKNDVASAEDPAINPMQPPKGREGALLTAQLLLAGRTWQLQAFNFVSLIRKMM